jgi:hypothetical protein
MRKRKQGVKIRDAVLATVRNILYDCGHELDRIGFPDEAEQLFTCGELINVAIDFGDRRLTQKELQWLFDAEE